MTLKFGYFRNLSYLCGVFAKDLHFVMNYWVYFYAQLEAYIPQGYKAIKSHGYPWFKTMCTVFGETGGDSLSFNNSNFSEMPKTGSFRVKANNSNRNFAPSSAKTVSYRKFEIEKNEKNKAYYFILSNGLLEAFTQFCKDYHSCDPNKDCIDFLLSDI